MPHDIFTKSKVKTIFAADLFCGASGTSTGLMNTAKALCKAVLGDK